MLDMENNCRLLAQSQAQIAVREWLETQSQVVGYWRDLLVSTGGSDDLIRVLDDHAAFLLAGALGWSAGQTGLQ